MIKRETDCDLSQNWKKTEEKKKNHEDDKAEEEKQDEPKREVVQAWRKGLHKPREREEGGVLGNTNSI